MRRGFISPRRYGKDVIRVGNGVTWGQFATIQDAHCSIMIDVA
jgi:hypothetical protein